MNEGPSCDDSDGPEFPAFRKSWRCGYFLFWNQKQILLTKKGNYFLKIDKHH